MELVDCDIRSELIELTPETRDKLNNIIRNDLQTIMNSTEQMQNENLGDLLAKWRLIGLIK